MPPPPRLPTNPLPARPIVSCDRKSPRHRVYQVNLLQHYQQSLVMVGHEAGSAVRSIGWGRITSKTACGSARYDTMPCHAMRLIFTAPLPPAAIVDRAGQLTRVTGKRLSLQQPLQRVTLPLPRLLLWLSQLSWQQALSVSRDTILGIASPIAERKHKWPRRTLSHRPIYSRLRRRL